MHHRLLLAGVLAPALLAASPAPAEMLIYGIQAEQVEVRFGEDSNVLAWDADAMIGTDELKLVLRSEGEYDLDADAFEALQNQIRLQTPVSTFFDAVAGISLDTPEGPDRIAAVIGLHGLAPQWFEVDADLFLSDHPSFRLEVDYEGLITNRIILTPSFEIDVPFTDDDARDVGAFGAKVEVGARLSYDLIDRAVAPYIGVHYERVFGETRDRKSAAGEDTDAVFLVAGVRLLF